ncbi:MAG: iron ABC transporter permease [Chloroflexi bacterium]|nr:iron ABC transporter permease [Chloroflexota bacterium]
MAQVAAASTIRTARRVPSRGILLFAIVVAVGFFTAYPVSLLLLRSFQVSAPGDALQWGLSGWTSAFGDDALVKAFANTLFLGSVRTGITLVLAIYFAWIVTRTNTPMRGFIEFMMWLGFFLPAIPMTMGWILLLDPFSGVLNTFLRDRLGIDSPFNIYSYGGIIWAHLAFSTSIRFLLLTPAFRSMDAALEEAGRIAGNNSLQVLRRVTIPVLAPAIIIGTSLGFIKSLESLEIELLLGRRAEISVFTTRIFDYLHWEPPLYGRATALSSIFLLVIFLMIWLQRIVIGKRHYTTVTGRGYRAGVNDIGGWRWVTFGTSMLFIGVMIILPLCMLLMGTFMRLSGLFDIPDPWTFKHWTAAFDDPVFIRSLRNTLIMGFGAATFGAVVYALIAYMIVRGRFLGRGLLDFFAWLPWAIPGVLVSLSLLWVFLGSGPIFKQVYGTIFILIIATTIGTLPLGVQILKASVMQMSPELEEASRVHGASWFRTVTRIAAPLMAPAIMSVGIISFISAIRDVPTVIFLANFQTRPLSLLMLDYIIGGEREKATVIGVFLAGLIVIVALAGRKIGLQMGNSENR